MLIVFHSIILKESTHKHLFFTKDLKMTTNLTLKTPPAVVYDNLDVELEEEDELKTRGKFTFFKKSFLEPKATL